MFFYDKGKNNFFITSLKTKNTSQLFSRVEKNRTFDTYCCVYMLLLLCIALQPLPQEPGSPRCNTSEHRMKISFPEHTNNTINKTLTCAENVYTPIKTQTDKRLPMVAGFEDPANNSVSQTIRGSLFGSVK